MGYEFTDDTGETLEIDMFSTGIVVSMASVTDAVSVSMSLADLEHFYAFLGETIAELKASPQ